MIGPDGRSPRVFRSRNPALARLSGVQRVSWSIALPSVEQALRTHQRYHHHKLQLQRMGQCLRRCQDDDRASRPPPPSLPDPRKPDMKASGSETALSTSRKPSPQNQNVHDGRSLLGGEAGSVLTQNQQPTAYSIFTRLFRAQSVNTQTIRFSAWPIVPDRD